MASFAKTCAIAVLLFATFAHADASSNNTTACANPSYPHLPDLTNLLQLRQKLSRGADREKEVAMAVDPRTRECIQVCDQACQKRLGRTCESVCYTNVCLFEVEAKCTGYSPYLFRVGYFRVGWPFQSPATFEGSACTYSVPQGPLRACVKECDEACMVLKGYERTTCGGEAKTPCWLKSYYNKAANAWASTAIRSDSTLYKNVCRVAVYSVCQFESETHTAPEKSIHFPVKYVGPQFPGEEIQSPHGHYSCTYSPGEEEEKYQEPAHCASEAVQAPQECPAGAQAGLEHFGRVVLQTLQYREVGDDPLFPPCEQSIGPPNANCGDEARPDDPEPCSKFNDWKTFQEVAEIGGFEKFSVFDESGIELADIGQGSLGNCYVMAAFATIANTHPHIIKAMFLEDTLWPENIFKTRWFINGKETIITVDNMVPANFRGDFFTKPSLTGEFWPVILDKAWAKAFGSYKNIEGGHVGNVVAAITGAPANFYKHNEMDLDALWEVLETSTNAKYTIGCGSDKGGNSMHYGLPEGHAYSVLNVKVMQGHGRVVVVYNPWRSDEYHGDIPNTEEVNGKWWNLGVFTMTLAEYKNAFSDTQVNRVRSDYTALSMPIMVEKAATATVSTSMPGDFDVEVVWPNWRMVQPCPTPFPEDLCPSVVLAADVQAITHGSKPLKHNPIDDTNFNHYNNIASEVANPKAGTYEVFAFAKFPKIQTTDDYMSAVRLSVYGPSGTKLQDSTMSSNELTLDLFGPTQHDKPCNAIQAPGKGVFMRNDQQQTNGVPTYLRLDGKGLPLDKQTVAYVNPSGGEWYISAASEAGPAYGAPLQKGDLSCVSPNEVDKVVMETYAPKQNGNICNTIIIPGRGIFTLDASNPILGAPSYWSNDKNTFAYLDMDGGQWKFAVPAWLSGIRGGKNKPTLAGIAPLLGADISCVNPNEVDKFIMETYAPKQSGKICNTINIPGRGTFTLDSSTPILGAPSYWSIDKNTFAYLDMDGGRWRVAIPEWLSDIQGGKAKHTLQGIAPLLGADISCGCFNDAGGVPGFTNKETGEATPIPCSKVTAEDHVYGNVVCGDPGFGPKVQTFCPETCGVCPTTKPPW